MSVPSVPLILKSMQFKAELKTALAGDNENVAQAELTESFKDICDFLKICKYVSMQVCKYVCMYVYIYSVIMMFVIMKESMLF